jgi:hypothetical protein
LPELEKPARIQVDIGACQDRALHRASFRGATEIEHRGITELTESVSTTQKSLLDASSRLL